MALDNAQFISELSITDPPGTDPLSEGDDQIRTSKRAVFQSFPLVDAAVNITAAQMNQMAIKDATNVFTQTNEFQANVTFGGRLRAIDGSLGNPVYSFTADNSTGMYSGGTNSLRFGANSIETLRMSSTLFRTFQVNQSVDGSNVAPTYSFTSDPTTGIRLVNPGILSFSVSGLGRASVTDSAWTFAVKINAIDGSAGDPPYGFDTDANTGMFHAAVNTIGFSTSAVERFRITSSGVTVFGQANIDALTDTVADLRYLRAGENRWQIRMATEAGFTVNNLQFRRFDINGVFQDIPFELELDRGTIIMATLPTNAGGLFNGMLWRNGNVVNIV